MIKFVYFQKIKKIYKKVSNLNKLKLKHFLKLKKKLLVINSSYSKMSKYTPYFIYYY